VGDVQRLDTLGF